MSFCSDTARHHHITPVLRALHWLPVVQRVKYKTLILVYKATNGLAPAYLNELLQRHEPSRGLRSSQQNLLIVPFTRSSVINKRAFSVAGTDLWNALPEALRNVASLELFKRNLRTHPFAEYFTQIQSSTKNCRFYLNLFIFISIIINLLS